MATPQVQNDPIYSLPWLYISGLNISVASDEIIAIAPGQARDSSDNIDMPVGFPNLQGVLQPSPLFLNSTVVGANGLDSGALAASTSYAIYLIGDSRYYKEVAGLISLASNAFPLLPFGYDSYRLLGFVGTDGSTDFDPATVINVRDYQAFYVVPPTSVLSGGNATTFTDIDLTPPMPDDLNAIAILDVVFIPAAVGDVVQFRPNGSAATSGLVTITGVAAGIPQVAQVQVVVGLATTNADIEYLVTSSSDSVSVSVAGWITVPA